MPHDPIHLCALADLALISADMFRRPEVASRRLEEASEGISQLLAAAGAPADLFAEVMDAGRRTDQSTWLDEYHRLFEGATLCPLNETTYVRRDKGAIIADLCGFYAAFGFEPARTTGEKPDHLLTQLEYLAMLLLLAARGEADSRAIVLDAINKLAGDHLCDWIAIAWERLALVTNLPYYEAAAEALRDTWALLTRVLQLPAPAAVVAPDPEPEEPYECAMVESGSAVEFRVRGQEIEP